MNPHQIIRFKWIYETLSYSRVQDLPPPAVSLQRHHTTPGLMEHMRGWRRNHKLNWKNRFNKSMTLPWNIFTLQICKIDILVTSNSVLWITLKKTQNTILQISVSEKIYVELTSDHRIYDSQAQVLHELPNQPPPKKMCFPLNRWTWSRFHMDTSFFNELTWHISFNICLAIIFSIQHVYAPSNFKLY